jgi:glc operon protein GlcG
MTEPLDIPAPCMRIATGQLKLEHVQAAMKAMMDEAQATSATPVCLAIVDASGNLEAFAKMDGARVFTRRHAVRKAYTAAVLGLDTIVHDQRMERIHHRVSEQGDPMITYEQGGVVIIQDGGILGGIGVGGVIGVNADDKLARVGLQAMNL